MSLRDAAATALDTEQAEQAAAEQAARDAFQADALAALGAVIALPDGKPAVKLDTLIVEKVDMVDRLVVATDPASTPLVSLSVRDAEGQWRVRLVRQVDGVWTRASKALEDLADVGAALEEASP